MLEVLSIWVNLVRSMSFVKHNIELYPYQSIQIMVFIECDTECNKLLSLRC